MEKLYTLKTILDAHPKIKLLILSEQSLEKSLEVKKLSNKVKTKEKQYNELIELYDAHHKLAKKAQKELFNAKMLLDQHPLVISYMKAYQDVRLLYEKINETIFNIFQNESCTLSC
ncbi:MAG: YlbF family regulator [Bacilli bacterium]|nr:YlbF family regulator [Erysipelotrichia bacterium]